MSIIGSNILAGASGQAGYNLNNSLRFRSSNSANLARTPASTTNQKTWTWSGWVKRGALSSGSYMDLFSAYVGANDITEFRYHFNVNDDTLMFAYVVGGVGYYVYSTNLFRDPSAWYHLVCSIDTTQATSTNRVKIYVNGVQVTQNAGGSGYPLQNVNTNVNTNCLHNIGYLNTYGRYFDGYMTEINFVDGQALTPSSFGETSLTTGSWIPKKYTSTYGTNGFYLKFADASAATAAAIGKDSSGNGNNWTPSGISVTAGVTYDAMLDVPTNTSATVANYPVWNPLVGSVGVTLSQANLSATFDTAGGTRYGTIGTIGVSSGKWYWEYEFSAGGNSALLGITQKPFAVQMGTYPGEQTGDYGYYGSNGNKYTAGSGSAYGATFTTSDVIGVALDLDAGTLTFYKNNTSQGTAFSSISGTFFPAIGKGITATGITSFVNFGQRPFTYTAPSGFVALNTYNLPTPTILQGNKYMDATLYTGNGANRSITNAASFRPDFVWGQARSAAYGSWLFDSVRGATKQLSSFSTNAESTQSTMLTAFNSAGFSMGTDTAGNQSSITYVGWQWQAGQGSSSSNTSGSITSTTSVSTTAGFSVVTYTGNGTAGATIGHGLGVAPSMFIVKNRSNAGTHWAVYVSALGNTGALFLSSTTSFDVASAYWNNTSPDNSVFSVGGSSGMNGNTQTYVAYCFAEIAGFSKFGSYTGNYSVNGPFVYCGFRPKFILIKCSSQAYDWELIDTSRSTYNGASNYLQPNLTSSEYSTTTDIMDILSNGFKLRTNWTRVNDSSPNTFIFMAFAENPFKNANAR